MSGRRAFVLSGALAVPEFICVAYITTDVVPFHETSAGAGREVWAGRSDGSQREREVRSSCAVSGERRDPSSSRSFFEGPRLLRMTMGARAIVRFETMGRVVEAPW